MIPQFSLFSQIAANWWTFLLRGLCAIAFGLLVMFAPASLILFFAIYVFCDGIFALVTALCGYGKHNRAAPTWWLGIMGIAGMLVGIVAFRHPVMAAAALVSFIGAWYLVSGIFTVFGSLDIPSGSNGKGMLIFNGTLSILFGAVVLAWPASGALALAWVVAFSAIFSGAALCAFAFQIRGTAKQIEKDINV